MANGFGTLFIGVSGLQSSQNALNITANNLANVDTAGYVRQQVMFGDRNYLTFNTTAAISKQQSGLGVQICDVVHTRDVFLDRLYRSESGRYSFYSATAEAAYEVETYFQELEGVAFQGALEDFWKSFEEFYKGPDDSVNQNLVLQKAQLFISRGKAIYDGLKSYQNNINTQISDDIDQINELGKSIYELNKAILSIEAGDLETAMTLRDARDLALDELSSLVDITYTEQADGVVKVSIEGTEFVDGARVYAMASRRDPSTGFLTPYWPHLSNLNKDSYVNVFNFKNDISSANGNDMGELKALILARGDKVANYTDVTGKTLDEYNNGAGMSVMMKAQAEFDQLMHGVITALNDVFCPNDTASAVYGTGAGFPITATAADGTQYTINADTKVLDVNNCSYGIDMKLPPRELFTRRGTERYTEVTANGETYYIYNEEDPEDTSKQYTVQSVSVNSELVDYEALIPHLMKNGDVNQPMALKLSEEVWSRENLTLNPGDPRPCSIKTYYIAMSGEMATFENIYSSAASSLAGSVASVDNQRQQVIGVSSDEELTKMIKFQNAYNASSRFINVVNEMIEHLITQLG